jgi:septal ring factor EnvC (AmiA/AmiB activator)
MKNDAGDTGDGLADDEKFLADLDKNCAAKQKLFEENVKYRSQELEALADTIIKGVHGGAHASGFDFIALALHGKKIGFEKVIGMIDDLVAELKKEQQDDDNKKEYCDAQFDKADDKKKELEGTIKDLDTAIAEAKEGIQTTKEEIDALEDGIRALDKSVAEATEQRQEENADYKALIQENSAAKELIGFAKNRLNKFYNPKLYKAALVQKDAPPPPPEGVESYSKKGEESNGIIAMMDALSRDLEKEMTEAKAIEKDAQGDYETFMSDSKTKRAEDSKSLTDKENTLATLQESLEGQSEEKASTEKTLQATNGFIDSLHAECDWLIKYFSMRKEARDNEADALEKAKAVLSGADYALVQSSRHSFLRRN